MDINNAYGIDSACLRGKVYILFVKEGYDVVQFESGVSSVEGFIILTILAVDRAARGRKL